MSNNNLFSPKNMMWAIVKKNTGIDLNPTGKYTQYLQRKVLSQVFDIPDDDQDKDSSEEDKGRAKKYGKLGDRK